MNALIIEDELPSARRLERFLHELEIHVLEKFTSVKSSIGWLKNNRHPDVIFLDVQLSDGLCFDIFDAVEVNSNIIFTTAHSDYSIKAFNYKSISYLVKPINTEELKKAISKARQYYQLEEDLRNYKELKEIYQSQNYKASFPVRVGNKIKIIGVQEVKCFYSYENATYIRNEHTGYILNHSLTEIESLVNPTFFFRVNRTFIVHINAIKDIISYTNSRLKLILHSYNENEIIVSRERVKDFKNWIDR